MKPERWQQVNDLFQSAVERAPEERAAFLAEACQGDERLRRAVERLIAGDQRPENFIEAPAFEVVPELLTNDPAGAMVGELIAYYRIQSLIGAGGMGEVYLATDERLGRKVALKFLPERLTADKMQLSRFKSEARAASALNHPNILTVYEIGAEGDRHFIATEFIEGTTLRESLAHGPMNLHDALEIAVQVASALAAAHEAGVVDRDIKPENIMLRRDGYVKVLDFGIAKLTERQRTSDDPNAKMTTLVQTHPSLLMGTVRYMSPEQMRGQPADARSDIWSLGVVVYEMVGGVPPFSAATPSDCIASVLKTEPPPLSGVVPGIPIDSSVFELPGYIARRQGDWKQCISSMERACEVDPRNLWLLQQTAQTYWLLRHFPDMARLLNRTLAVSPGDAATRLARALIDLESCADAQPACNTARDLLNEDPAAVDAISEQWFYVALCRRDADGISYAVASLSPEGIIPFNVRMPRSFCEGLAARARRDAVAAEKAFHAARVEMENLLREQPDYAEALCVLGMADAALGRKEEALREGQRAVELLSVTKDAMTGAEVLRNLAIIYAWTGEKDLALKQLEELLPLYGPISYGQLRLHPWWDPLRDDPRFDKIVEESKKPVALK
jgi:serine/threonine protein kinase